MSGKNSNENIKYFRIKNWEKYQHRDCARGTGPMRWIRFETAILDCDKTAHLSAHDRLTWCLLLALAGRLRNKIKHSRDYVRKRLGMHRGPDLALFEELGLIEIFFAGKMPAKCQPTIHNITGDAGLLARSGYVGDEKTTTIKPPVQTKKTEFENHWNKGNHELLDRLISYWNSKPKLSKKRKAERPFGKELIKIWDAFESRPDESYWRSAIDELDASKFLTERKLGFGWLITSGKADSLVAGQYAEPDSKKVSTQNILRVAPQNESAQT